MAQIVPVQKSCRALTSAGLVNDFKMSDRVLRLLVNSAMDDLDDFRFFFSDKKEVNAFIAEDTTIKDNEFRIQVARLRKARAAVRQSADQKRAIQQTVHEYDCHRDAGSVDFPTPDDEQDNEQLEEEAEQGLKALSVQVSRGAGQKRVMQQTGADDSTELPSKRCHRLRFSKAIN